jgi:hypothetical protein
LRIGKAVLVLALGSCRTNRLTFRLIFSLDV